MEMPTSLSLLDRLRERPDEASWRQLDELYRPLILRWVRRDAGVGNDAEDLAAEVMLFVCQEIRGFNHQRTGSFRKWLRTITYYRIQAHFRKQRSQPTTVEEHLLGQIANDRSELAQNWDQEHNEHVVRKLLEMVEGEFNQTDARAFRLYVLEGQSAAQVAETLGVTRNVVPLREGGPGGLGSFSAPELPSFDVKKIGHYLRPKEVRPSVLVQRDGENRPWTVVRSGQGISTGHTLVSLPGYESLIVLDSGVRLKLWGNLPEFIPVDLRESIVLLNAPKPGVDADLILDRGRVEIASGSKARVKVRFDREVWDVSLAGPGSKVCIDLWYSSNPGGPLGPSISLFSQGKVSVNTGRQEIPLPSPAALTWHSRQPIPPSPEKLKEVPDWWSKSPEKTDPVLEALRSLQDWAQPAKGLDDTKEVIDTIRVVVQDATQDRSDRLLGLLFLAALDETFLLIESLKDQTPYDGGVRTTAAFGLQNWLLRNPHRRAFLAAQFQKHRYSRDKADRLVALLEPLTPKVLADQARYQELIGYLDHPDIPFRHLAHWHLYRALASRMPSEAVQIEYDPMMEETGRRQARAEWQKRIPKGQVPGQPGEKSRP